MWLAKGWAGISGTPPVAVSEVVPSEPAVDSCAPVVPSVPAVGPSEEEEEVVAAEAAAVAAVELVA